MIRTLIQSETTVVPPVTAERSPPLSRITGALSPVIAASLTLATPSTISPSAGTTSPASTRTISPTCSLWAAVGTMVPRSGSTISLALVVTRAARRLSAAALPRPSATLSAQLANSTVAQSQSAICRATPQAAPSLMASPNETVASIATISVAKITGFPVRRRGSSLAKASAAARPSMAPEKLPATPVLWSGPRLEVMVMVGGPKEGQRAASA